MADVAAMAATAATAAPTVMEAVADVAAKVAAAAAAATAHFFQWVLNLEEPINLEELIRLMFGLSIVIECSQS